MLSTRWFGLLGALSSAIAGCGGLPAEVPRNTGFDGRRLDGAFYVLATNFPMWLDGSKREPIFIYRPIEGTSPLEIEDTVAYTEGGRKETILGTDTQDPQRPEHFTWRGKGLLTAFTSDWAVLHVGPDTRWMILYFTKTLATPEGVDVIAQQPALSDEDKAEVTRILKEDSFLSEKAKGLVWLGR